MADDDEGLPYSDILRTLPLPKFIEVFGASARKAREVYFHRHGIRAPKAAGFAKPGQKNEARTEALFDVLRDQDDDELAQEVLRSYLLSKRQLLGAALDHLGIAHQNGLTDSDDVKKIEKLSKRELRDLAKKLEQHGDALDIAVYLKFMGAKDVDAAVAS